MVLIASRLYSRRGGYYLACALAEVCAVPKGFGFQAVFSLILGIVFGRNFGMCRVPCAVLFLKVHFWS